MHMLQRVEPYVAYGYPNLKTVKVGRPAGARAVSEAELNAGCGLGGRRRAATPASSARPFRLASRTCLTAAVSPAPRPTAGADLQARLWQGQQAAHPADRQLGGGAGALSSR